MVRAANPLIVATTLSFLAWQMSPSPAAADGWHNAALASSSLDQWLADVKAAVPDLNKKMSSNEVRAGLDLSDLKKKSDKTPAKTTSPRKGGSVSAELTPQQQQLLGRKANDCLEALAYMDNKNIFPREFPNFQLKQIPQYHKAAKQLLSLMGPVGGQAVVGQLRSELMGMGRPQGRDLTLRPDYYEELLKLLREIGMRGEISEADLGSLREAASGAKDRSLAPLARQVNDVLADIEAAENLGLLVERIENLSDAKRKQQLTSRARKKIPKAETSELIDGLRASQGDSPLRKEILQQLRQRLDRMSVLDLFRLRDSVKDTDLGRSVDVELGQKRPEFKEVKRDLPEIVKYLGSDDAALAAAAQDQLINAFQRAPIRDCLDWLARDDKRLAALIWKQLDDRIARAGAMADPKRKIGYRELGLEVARDKASRSAMRGAAVDLLGRLGDKEAAGGLIEILPQLPRETWGKAGAALAKLTGEKFGPKPGDGVAELNAALKKWRAWWQSQQKR